MDEVVGAGLWALGAGCWVLGGVCGAGAGAWVCCVQGSCGEGRGGGEGVGGGLEETHEKRGDSGKWLGLVGPGPASLSPV